MKVWILSLSHRHGTDVTVHRTQKGAERALVSYCRRWWWEVQALEDDDDLKAPRSREQLVADYFVAMEDGSYEIQEHEVRA